MTDDNVIEWPLKGRAKTVELFVNGYIQKEREEGREPDDESIATVEEVARGVSAEYIELIAGVDEKLQALAADGSLKEAMKIDPSIPDQILDSYLMLLHRMAIEIFNLRVAAAKAGPSSQLKL